MQPRWLISAAAVAVVLLAVIATAPDEPACRAPETCDCEAVQEPPIRQPGNAWSSLSLLAAGAWVAARPRRASGPDLALGVALAATGAAAFSYHANLTGWSARLDETAVAMLAATLAAHRWAHRIAFPTGAVIGAFVVAGAVAAGIGGPAALALALAALLGHIARGVPGDVRLALGAATALGGGALLWLAADRGTWCESGPWFQAHAAWHVAAAAAGVLVAAYLRSCQAGRSLYPDAGDIRHEGP